MNKDVASYHSAQVEENKVICELLYQIISESLPEAENKVWHAHPVWFLDGNPIVGYSALKDGVRLMFWSGADFDESGLTPGTGKFKDASMTYEIPDEINESDIKRWLEKSKRIQWDYKNLVKKRGKFEKLKP